MDKKVQKLKLEADIVTNLKMTNISLKLQDTDVQILSQKLETQKTEHNEFTESVRKTMSQLQGEADVAACKCRQVVQIV